MVWACKLVKKKYLVIVENQKKNFSKLKKNILFSWTSLTWLRVVYCTRVEWKLWLCLTKNSAILEPGDLSKWTEILSYPLTSWLKPKKRWATALFGCIFVWVDAQKWNPDFICLGPAKMWTKRLSRVGIAERSFNSPKVIFVFEGISITVKSSLPLVRLFAKLNWLRNTDLPWSNGI